MNVHAIRSIYRFEMARTFRTLAQSILAPVITTSLYFVVFGSAIGSRMAEIDGVPYGAFIVPGLILLSVVTESIGNASFGIYFPKWSGTIYELLSAPLSVLLLRSARRLFPRSPRALSLRIRIPARLLPKRRPFRPLLLP